MFGSEWRAKGPSGRGTKEEDTPKKGEREHFYRSYLLLPRKKVVYRTMVVYCQMANQQQKKNKNIPSIPPQNKEKQTYSNTMVIYFSDKTSAIFLSFLTIFE